MRTGAAFTGRLISSRPFSYSRASRNWRLMIQLILLIDPAPIAIPGASGSGAASPQWIHLEPWPGGCSAPAPTRLVQEPLAETSEARTTANATAMKRLRFRVKRSILSPCCPRQYTGRAALRLRFSVGQPPPSTGGEESERVEKNCPVFGIHRTAALVSSP